LDRRLGGPQSRSGQREEEKILDQSGTRTPTLGRVARSQSLYRLRYEIKMNKQKEENSNKGRKTKIESKKEE
jgi:uncharacterized protein YerC